MTDRLLPFTPAWADAFRQAIEGDAAYRAAAARWTWPVALVLSPAEPALGFPEPVGVRLTLDRGACTAAEIAPAEACEAPFVLTAPYATWKAIVTGALDAMTAVATRQVAFRGNLATLLLHAAAAKALVACAQAVPTRFPDDPSI